MKPEVHVIAPRYAFGPEHSASANLVLGENHIDVEPLDVSKGHICVSAPQNIALYEGDSINQLSVSVFGKNYTFNNIILSKKKDCPSGRFQRLVLKSPKDSQSNAHLWEISFNLRMRPSEIVNKDYDRFDLPKIPARGIYTELARQERLAFLSENTNKTLHKVAKTDLDPAALVSNIEAFIGSVELPVGIAGPLHIKGEHANGLYYAPLATSEGALVASATRGATALSRSGGVTARVLGQRMFRVPVFVLENLSMALFFAEWVKDHHKEIAEQAHRYSNFAKLVEVQAHVLGKAVHVYFVYETGDAAGQNMTTTCTWQACQWIINEVKCFKGLEFENFLVDANLSNDKKVTYQSFLRGRGIRVLAEAVLTKEVCQQILKIKPKQLYEAYTQVVSGSIASGMIGMNINIANVIAAMFASTGQDIACVHESSIGQLHLELTESEDLYATLMLPSLVVGSVGGGTNLPQQRECLDLLDCAGPGCAHKLAEIIVSFCLALDLSTLSAVASDQFARAHEKLGRNRPVEWLKLSDLDDRFFTQGIQQFYQDNTVQVVSSAPIDFDMKGSSIITELTAHKINKLVGHYPYRLTVVPGGDSIDVLAKVKPLDAEVILTMNSMAGMCDARLAHAFNEFKHQLGFENCHTRELNVMSQKDERFIRHAPVTYFQYQNPDREAYVLVQEFLTNLEMMDSIEQGMSWTHEHIQVALTGIAEIHSIWFGKDEELLGQNFNLYQPNTDKMKAMTRLWSMLGVHAYEEFPEWFSEKDMEVYRRCLSRIGSWYSELDAMPKTLVHNDFNPRNIAFRRVSGQLRLCAYDWELAAYGVPQRDLAELLAFTLDQNATKEDVNHFVEHHRQELQRSSGCTIDPELWRRGYQLSLWELMVSRIPMYLMAHTFRHYSFMLKLQKTLRHLILLESHQEG